MFNIYVENDYGTIVDNNFSYPIVNKILSGNLRVDNLKLLSDAEYAENSVFMLGTNSIGNLSAYSQKLSKIHNKKLLVLIPQSTLSFKGFHSHNFLENIKNFIEMACIKNEDVYVISRLQTDKEFIHKIIPNCHHHYFDVWLYEFFHEYFDKWTHRTDIPNSVCTNKFLNKKFAVFSNRFEYDRFTFYCDLAKHGILDNAHYSFGNLSSTAKGALAQCFGNDELLASIAHYKNNVEKQKIETWIKNIPYYLCSDPTNTHAFEINEACSNADLNIVIENFCNVHDGFISEKTYRPMYLKKPFIVYSMPGCLEIIRKLGYQTFHPYIDESYDLEDDIVKRKKMILSEIIRLNKMSNEQFKSLFKHMSDICSHNHQVLANHHYHSEWPAEFTIEHIAKWV